MIYFNPNINNNLNIIRSKLIKSHYIESEYDILIYKYKKIKENYFISIFFIFFMSIHNIINEVMLYITYNVIIDSTSILFIIMLIIPILFTIFFFFRKNKMSIKIKNLSRSKNYDKR